jgi:hypothetical protein
MNEDERLAENIRVFCDHCPDYGDCIIGGEPSAMERCQKVIRNRVFLLELNLHRRTVKAS